MALLIRLRYEAWSCIVYHSMSPGPSQLVQHLSHISSQYVVTCPLHPEDDEFEKSGNAYLGSENKSSASQLKYREIDTRNDSPRQKSVYVLFFPLVVS